MVELELPRPLLQGQVLRQINPQPIQSYHTQMHSETLLSKHQETGAQVIAATLVSEKREGRFWQRG
jgi:hypothetical protein